MYEPLFDALRKGGWLPGTYRGFLRQRRGGIDWEVGVGRAGRLELRWRYQTASGERDGSETLSENAAQFEIEDAMTGVYLRVHERPDPSRVFGNAGRRRASRRPAGTEPGPSVSPEEAGQGELDL